MYDLIYLVGYRGVGKSSAGRILAGELGYDFFDTDLAIIEIKKAEISAIVAAEGWPEFRRCEREVLIATKSMRRVVVATGGGAVLHDRQWQDMPEWSLVFWLTAADDIILTRLGRDLAGSNQRPCLGGVDAVDDLRIALHERIPLYRQVADIEVDTGNLTAKEVAATMSDLILGIGSIKT